MMITGTRGMSKKTFEASIMQTLSMIKSSASVMQVSVKQLAALLLDIDTPEGAEKLQVYVLACVSR